MFTTNRPKILIGALAALLAAAPALAEQSGGEGEAEAVVDSMKTSDDVAAEGLSHGSSTSVATSLGVAPEPTDEGPTPQEAWSDSRHWRYGTDYLFPLTRGGDETGMPTWGRILASPVTVAIDAALLPFGLIAGLFGDGSGD
jgi:hypothetical protein